MKNLLFTAGLLLIAFAGILIENGRGTLLTWSCVAPLALWVLFLVVVAIVNWLRSKGPTLNDKATKDKYN